MAEYAACLELRTLDPSKISYTMKSVVDPRKNYPGEWCRRTIRSSVVPVNTSQRNAIESMRWALEKIQGPPGTGKSTTNFHLLIAEYLAGKGH